MSDLGVSFFLDLGKFEVKSFSYSRLNAFKFREKVYFDMFFDRRVWKVKVLFSS